jgi:hypothetical protein
MAVGLIKNAKELAQGYQPLLLAEFTLQSGPKLRVASHPLNVTEGGFQYAGVDWLARVMSYDITATQALSESGIDYTPSVTINMADTNRDILTNFEQAVGMKGAVVKLTFIFWNVGTNQFSTDSMVRFMGVCGSPQVDNDSISVQATSMMNMSQAMLPQVRIQKRCGWVFPIIGQQRQEGADDESSQFYMCGYSPDATGSNKCGNYQTGTTPYTSCNYTYSNCLERLGKTSTGDITKDNANRPTGRFGGIQWSIPTTSWSRGYVSGKWDEITTTENEAKYGDIVPLQYGPGWSDPLVLTTDGSDNNLTKMQVVLGWGQFTSVDMVLVNGTIIPHTFNDGEMSYVPPGVKDTTEAMKSGWWIAVNNGDRNGAIAGGIKLSEQPDPYGSMCVIEIVVPKKLADSSQVPKVQVLAKGPKVRVWYDADPGGATLDTVSGMYWRKEYTENLAWILMDVLTWAYWRYADLNIASFIEYAAVCDGTVTFKDQFGNFTSQNADASTHKRYTGSLILRQRRSVAEIVRGLRTAGKALLYLDTTGLLTVVHKGTLATQQPAAIDGSNYNTAITSQLLDGSAANGYVAYDFNEGNIARRTDGKTSLSITQRALNDAPNRVTFNFQDRDNRFIPDSMTVIDAEDVARVGQEVTGQMSIDGINNWDQGRRCAGTWMAENYRGNARMSAYGSPIGDTGGTTTFEWETTFKVVHLNVGDICRLSYQHLNISNQLVRITKVQPTNQYGRVKLTAMHHNDIWYTDLFSQEDSPLWKPSFRNRELRPAYAWCPDIEQPPVNDSMYGPTDKGFGIAQDYETAADGSAIAKLVVTGKLPVNVFSDDTTPPFVGLQGTTASTGGTITGSRTYWFQVCSTDANGKLSAPSHTMLVAVPAGTNTNTVTIPVNYWPSNATGWYLFGGYSPMRLCYQANGTGKPASITLTDMNVASWGVPDTEFNSLTVRVKRVVHSGCWGAEVSEVATNLIKVATLPNAPFDNNQWADYDITLLGQKDADAVNLPIWNARVTSSDTAGYLNLGTTYPDTSPVHEGDVLVARFKPTVGTNSTGDYIEDLGIANNLGGLGPSFSIGNCSNASPIEVTTDVAHPYQTGDVVYIDGVNGNTAANGKWTITKTGTTTFTLDGSTGNAAYTDGGIVREMQIGMNPGTEKGLVLFFIAGTGKGMSVKVKDNTQTRWYIEGKWPVTPDSTSRFIVVEPAWELEAGSGTVNNGSTDTQVPFTLEATNYSGSVILAQAFTVDGGGDESFPLDSPFREIYRFGGTGAGGYKGCVYLLADGNLSIGSDLAPVVTLNSTTRAVAVRAEVKQPPVGAGLTFRVNIGSDPWMTLTIPDGQTFVEASGAQLAAAPDLLAATRIKLDITAVGTSSPGTDLTVTLFI